jgi:hypothetical protein
MNQHVKIPALAALLLSTALQSKADQTNLVQHLSIRLSGITQGPTETNKNVVKTSADFARVGTADVIKQLGIATGNSFSDQADLVVVTPLPSGSSSIVIRDGNSSVNVSSFFIYEVKSGFVTSSQSNLKTGRTSSTDYSVQRLALIDSPNYPLLSLHFDLQGIAVEMSTTGPSMATRTELDASVSGWGDQEGKLLLLEGTFRVHGYSLEVVPSAPPPNA